MEQQWQITRNTPNDLRALADDIAKIWMAASKIRDDLLQSFETNKDDLVQPTVEDYYKQAFAIIQQDFAAGQDMTAKMVKRSMALAEWVEKLLAAGSNIEIRKDA